MLHTDRVNALKCDIQSTTSNVVDTVDRTSYIHAGVRKKPCLNVGRLIG